MRDGATVALVGASWFSCRVVGKAQLMLGFGPCGVEGRRKKNGRHKDSRLSTSAQPAAATKAKPEHLVDDELEPADAVAEHLGLGQLYRGAVSIAVHQVGLLVASPMLTKCLEGWELPAPCGGAQAIVPAHRRERG